MSGHEWNDERIGRLLGASRSAANPAVLARVRSRLAAREASPGWLAFLGSPVALATACALLLVSGVLSFNVVRADRLTAATASTSLVSALLDDDGTYGLPAAAATTDAGTVSDSNGVTP